MKTPLPAETRLINRPDRTPMHSSSRSCTRPAALRATAALIGLVGPLFALGCGGSSDSGGTGSTGPTSNGSFVLAATSTLSLAQGGSGTVFVTIVRLAPFTGAVSLSVSGLPSGVTGTFTATNIAAGQTTGTLTITTTSSTPVGTTNLTITGTGSGVSNATANVALTITAGTAQTGPFTMSLSVSSFLILPATMLSQPPLLTITRNAGFAGSVALTTTGLPATMLVSYSPSTVTGSTSSLLILDIGTPPGTYTATVTGTAAGGQGQRTITFQVVVATATTGNIHWKFCSGTTPQYFFAVKDGSGPWTRVMPSSTDSTFSFNINSATGSVAMVTNDSGGFITTVYNYTAAEMAARAASQCALVPNVTSRTVNGTFGGVTGFRESFVGMGWWSGSADGNGSFSLLNLPSGALDVVGAESGDIAANLEQPVIRGIIRRGVNPASGSTLPVLDFTAAESFAPTTATWTFNGVGSTEMMSITQAFMTAGGTFGALGTYAGLDRPDTIRTIYGFPAAQTITGDLHQVVATINTVGTPPAAPNRASRQIIAYARSVSSARTIAFGPAMPAPTVTAVGGGRLRATGTLPAAYSAGVSLDVTQTSTARFANVQATSGFLGTSGTYDIQMPDLTGAVGWDTQFGVISGIPTNWWLSGGGPVLDFYDARYVFNSVHARWTGAQTGIVAPADGAVYLMGRTIGTATP
jgi:hypothetical protein